MILIGNLRHDIAENIVKKYSETWDDEGGWKEIHADVFRPPENYHMLCCVCCGEDAQLALTTFATICFSEIGFLSPSWRGSLVNWRLFSYVLSGTFSGYVSSCLYKTFKKRRCQFCTLATAALFPGIAFSMFLFLNVALSFMESSASVPFLYIVGIAAIWWCVAVPLVFVGAYFGYKADPIYFPTATSTIARAIPKPHPIFNPLVSILWAGLMSYGAVHRELFFMMSQLWMFQYDYVFRFTLIIFFILIITCAEATLLEVFAQLCAENHRWWWFSFFASESIALYTFIGSISYFKRIEASRMLTTYLLCFGYMGLICLAVSLVTGTVGVLSSLWLVKMLFGNIKVDNNTGISDVSNRHSNRDKEK